MRSKKSNKIDILLSFLECTDGWIRVYDTCVWKSEDKKSFYYAAKHCQDLYPGARLYEPPNKSHNDLTYSLLSVNDYHWIGIHERISEGSWVYLSSNEPIPFTNWASNQPNDYQGDQETISRFIKLTLFHNLITKITHHAKWH